jgi:hypothetical protein
MSFKFDSGNPETLTLDNNEAPHRLEVFPGMYSPSCSVMGSTPPAKVMIMMGDKDMIGRMVEVGNGNGRQYVAAQTQFKGYLFVSTF